MCVCCSEDGYAEEQPAAPSEEEKRSMDPEMAAMYSQLSAEDQALLKVAASSFCILDFFECGLIQGN